MRGIMLGLYLQSQRRHDHAALTCQIFTQTARMDPSLRDLLERRDQLHAALAVFQDQETRRTRTISVAIAILLPISVIIAIAYGGTSLPDWAVVGIMLSLCGLSLGICAHGWHYAHESSNELRDLFITMHPDDQLIIDAPVLRQGVRVYLETRRNSERRIYVWLNDLRRVYAMAQQCVNQPLP